MEMRKKVNFVSFLVDRSKLLTKVRSAAVGEMIYIVFYYYLRRAKLTGAENGIFRDFFFQSFCCGRGVPPVQTSAMV